MIILFCDMKVSLTQSLLSTKTFFWPRDNTSQETWQQTDRRATLHTTWSQWTGNVCCYLFRHLLILELLKISTLFKWLPFAPNICIFSFTCICLWGYYCRTQTFRTEASLNISRQHLRWNCSSAPDCHCLMIRTALLLQFPGKIVKLVSRKMRRRLS